MLFELGHVVGDIIDDGAYPYVWPVPEDLFK